MTFDFEGMRLLLKRADTSGSGVSPDKMKQPAKSEPVIEPRTEKPAPPAKVENSPGAAGHWEGNIQAGSVTLPIAVDLSRKEDGSWAGTISVPTQSIKDRALEGIDVKEANIAFKIAGIPGDPSFSGKLSNDGKTMSGEFSQGGGKFAFQLERSSEKKNDKN